MLCKIDSVFHVSILVYGMQVYFNGNVQSNTLFHLINKQL